MKKHFPQTKNLACLLVILLLSLVLCGCSGHRTYDNACQAMARGDYLDAISAFESIPDYPEAGDRILECYYKQGTAYDQQGDYASAYHCFCNAGTYEDAPFQAQRMLYAQGHAAFLDGDYQTADSFFQQLEGSQEDYGFPHFATLAEAQAYLTEQRTNLNLSIAFHIDASDDEFGDALRSIFPTASISDINYTDDMLLTITVGSYMPSDKILWAIENEQYVFLSPDELTAMNKAKEIVQEAAAAASSDYELELQLHDQICETVSYQYAERFDPEAYREMSCIGALVDGKADSWGYADAFYLVSRMAGLEVNVVCGLSEGYAYYWNTILLDGKTYIVDACSNDLETEKANGWGYFYFNTTSCDDHYLPYGGSDYYLTAAPSGDLSRSYYHHNDAIFDSIEAASDYLVKDYERGGHLWTHAIITEADADSDEIGSTLDAKLWKYFQYARSYSWTWWTIPYGENTYVTVFWYE